MKGIFIILFFASVLSGQNIVKTHDLSLDEALKIALSKNFDLIKSEYEVIAAKGRFWSSISLPQPKVALSHEFVPTGKGLSFFQERTLEISQEIEFPTNIFLKGSRSNYEIDVYDNEKDKISLEVASKVRYLYKDALIKDKKVALADDNYKIAKDFLEKAESRQKAGEGTKLESITAKMQLSDALVSLESAKKEYKHSINELLASLNNSDFNNQDIILSDSLSFAPLDIKLDDLIIDAMGRNHQLKKSTNLLNIASINKSLAWSGFLPNLSFSYYKQAIPDNSDFYGFSFGISLPLWFLFEQRGQIEESSANYIIAQEEVKAIKNNLELNLRNAYSSFMYEQEQIKLYMKELLPQSEEVFNLAKLSYNSGEINYVEFLQAKQNLISIRTNYFNSLSGYYSSLYLLETAVGKLFR